MLVVGANLTQDRIVALPELVPGAVLRARQVASGPGGKPVNVARVAAALGERPTLVANLPGHLGERLAGLLREEPLDLVAVPTHGEMRTATILLEADGRVTVVNEPGPDLGGEDAAALREAATAAVAQRRPQVVVLSGSLPPGAPARLYAELSLTAQGLGSTVLVDAGGAALLAVLEAGADIVKPNLAEAEAALETRRADGPAAGATGATTELVDDGAPDIAARCSIAARELVARGARAALVSGGRRGVALHQGTQAWWFPAPVVDAVNTVGAGDALAAGVAVALERGARLPEAVRHGVAVAAESVRHAHPGVIDAAAVDRLLAEVAEPAAAAVAS